MCILINSLPAKSKDAVGKKRSAWLGLRPTAAGEYYKFRILGFKCKTTDRTDPFIERFVHQYWETNPETGKKTCETIVCPTTPYVKVEGNKYDSCEICNFAKMAFNTWKESGWKDREAAAKKNMFTKRYEACIPVYVISDPTYAGNEGQFRVLVLNDQKFYKELRNKIREVSMSASVFNGAKGVDLYIHMTETEEVTNEGTPKEFHKKIRKIDKWGFTKIESAHEIPQITPEKLDSIGFDDEFYAVSSPAEIHDFYVKHIKVANDDIPEDDSVEVYTNIPSKPTNTVKLDTQNTLPVNTPNEVTKDLINTIDDLPFDNPAEDQPSAQQNSSNDATNQEIEDLLAGL